jgi:hypothetical protein
VSTGTPSLDTFIGGGLALGSLVVLYEDSLSHFHSHFLKSYLAEGVVNDHKVLIVDPEMYRDREYWLKFLPAVFKAKESAIKEESKDKDANLKVAWRYNTLLEGSSSSEAERPYRFDNSKSMGTSFANSQSTELRKEECTVYLGSSDIGLVDLWERIIE